MTRLNLVTGGAGFVGRHLVRLLSKRGERVRILDIADPGPVGDNVEVVRGSITEPQTVRQSLEGAHRLYHLAAIPNLWIRDRQDYTRVNVEGTRIVLDEAARFDLDRIVYTSTESILKSVHRNGANGLSNGSEVLSVDEVAGAYCRSKHLAERLAFEAVARGQPVVIVNPTMPLGAGDNHMTPPMKMLLRFLDGKAPAFLETEFNLVHVEDVAHGHILAAENGAVGQRYVLGGENIKLSEIVAILEEVSGLKMPRRKIPYWVAISTASISEFISDHFTGRPPIAPIAGVRLAGLRMKFDCSKAIRELGLPQTPVRQAIAEAVAWLHQDGRLKRRPLCRSLDVPGELGPQGFDSSARAVGDGTVA